MRRALVVVVVLGVLAGCGGGDDDADDPAAAARACTDLKAVGTLNAETADDVRAIAGRDGVPDDLRTAIEDLVGALGGDETQAGAAQQKMIAVRDRCAAYRAEAG